MVNGAPIATSCNVVANDYVAPEMTANQPGFSATASAAMYAGKGLIGALTVGNYNIKGVDANGSNVPSDLSLSALLGTLHYNTDIDFLGGKYRLGATLVSGGLYPGESDKDMNGKLLSVSRNTWVTPIKINEELANDVHVATSYTFRLRQNLGNTNTARKTCAKTVICNPVRLAILNRHCNVVSIMA
ncbi:hypothetical protein [Vibrio breoganii]|uniref:Uncharacterized protein n=1 Tax=Vibrio breoganii TaxID=553239 RepID=A0ABX1UE59_9VIBR|nr:hypothetical protein [Vibrio breoganii]NMO75205.1 hypothetical protein [Vibrio breoganii]NMR71721.1 hypothetical protein [Vibrio breoganii]PMF97872.1 hypothetical protein BCV02_17795 [Vibrio breoganii]PMG91277.1 hypothetical protein BCU79_17465 [Vibrio breoganii]PML86535.1 hypothetical protein BCT67_13610 [Vibrio breoganii]